MNGGFVYFITDGEYTKIGIAGDYRSRFKGLQTSSARELKLLFAVPVYDMITAEYVLHTTFEAMRVRGEWFKLSAQDIEFGRLVADQYRRDSDGRKKVGRSTQELADEVANVPTP